MDSTIATRTPSFGQLFQPTSVYKMCEQLHEAAKKGDTKECQKLLSKSSVDPNTTDWNGRAPLHYAAGSGHTSTCELLVQKRANINQRGRFDGMTPLMCAAENHHLQTCQKLIELQANTLATDVSYMDFRNATVQKQRPLSQQRPLSRQMTI